jgi:hypothetical protein
VRGLAAFACIFMTPSPRPEAVAVRRIGPACFVVRTTTRARPSNVVQRPDQHALPAQQSIALVLLFDGLRVVADAAATGTAGNGVGQGPVLHDSTEVIEDRGADPHHGTEGVDFAGRWVSPRRALPANP